MADKVTVRSILVGWLKEHGYDGLSNNMCECGLDELGICGCIDPGCAPGYAFSCPVEVGQEETCPYRNACPHEAGRPARNCSADPGTYYLPWKPKKL